MMLRDDPTTVAVDARTGIERDDGMGRVRPWRLVVAVCVALALLSLLMPSVPTYDPMAWLIWGRELSHGHLSTTAGPSWKPLPVLFTTPFSLLGDHVAPLAWLVVARAGGLLAVAMAYRLAARRAGPVGGVIAAVALVLAGDYVFNTARGNSEGILIAVCLWAIERHLDGHRTAAFALGIAAALLRPEIWPLVAVYALYLLRTDRSRRIRMVVLVGAAVVAVLWFVPEYLGSGNFLRAATRARDANSDSAANAEHPVLAVFQDAQPLLSLPVYVGALLALVMGVRRREPLLLMLGATAAFLVVVVAAMTQAGFAGNLRYLALPAALVCVLAGIGWGATARASRAVAGPIGVAGVIAVGAVIAYAPVRSDLRDLDDDAATIGDEADLDGSIGSAIAAAGGRDAVLRCGPVHTGAFQTQLVAWHLNLREQDVLLDVTPTPPGSVIAPRLLRMARAPGFTPLATTEHWIVSASC